MTSAPWPPKRTITRPHGGRPEIEALTGLRSGKPHYYPEYRISAERLHRVIYALERISAALVHTTEGSQALVDAVVEATVDHLSARWVVFALVDGELPDANPRFLVHGPKDAPPDAVEAPATVWRHLEQVRRGTGTQQHDHRNDHETGPGRQHLHVPILLDGRVVGAMIAWTPPERQIDETDQSVLRILAGQTAAALQNCALLDHSARLHARTTRQADELLHTQAELGAARQREVLDEERHRIARELHDSVSQYALSAGMHIELVRSEVTDPRLRAQLGTAKDLTRRAVEQLRSAIYALSHANGPDADLPSMLRRLSGVHMPDELRVEVRIGGDPVPLPAQCEQSLFRIAGEALFNTAMHAEASRAVVRLAYRPGAVRLTVSDNGKGRPDQVRRSLRAAALAVPSGEHRGLPNMQARARQLGGALSFRRARLGGLQVQVDIPVAAP